MKNIFIFLFIFFIFGCTAYQPKSISKTESSLTYDQDQYDLLFNESVTIAPSSIPKDISNCSITPDLPSGLTLENNCRITGSPIELKERTVYTLLATSSNSSHKFTLSLLVHLPEQSQAFFYPQTSYKYYIPTRIQNIVPIVQNIQIKGCISDPILPIGFSLRSDCTVSGFFDSSLSATDYTITAYATDNNVYSTKFTLEGVAISSSVSDQSLKFHFKSTLPNPLKNLVGSCSTQDKWYNLINGYNFLKRENIILSDAPCLNNSNFIGTGEPKDPYRFHSEGDLFKFPDFYLGSQSYTFSFWVRTLSQRSNLITAMVDDYSSSDIGREEYNLNQFGWTNYSTLFEIYNSENPFIYAGTFQPMYGQTAKSGLFIYDDSQNWNNNGRLDDSYQSQFANWYLPQGEWHLITFVVNGLASPTTTKMYVDGFLVKSETLKYYSNGGVLATSGVNNLGNNNHNYFFGGKGITEWGEIKIFNRPLTDTEVSTECSNNAFLYDKVSCGNSIKSLLGYLPNANTSSCSPMALSMSDLTGTLGSKSTDTTLSFENPSGLSISEQIDCSQPKTSFIFPANTSQKTLYFKSSIKSDNLVVKMTPNNDFQKRQFTWTVSNPPENINVFFSSGCGPDITFDVKLTDSSNNTSYVDNDTNIAFEFHPSTGSVYTVNKTILNGTADGSFKIYTAGESSGSIIVKINGLANKTLTYAFSVCSWD